jgi:uncharacterized membrane protein (UPF0127 family)
MEALCRLSYPGGREMISTRPAQPWMTCHDVRMRIILVVVVAVLSIASCAKDEPTFGVASVVLRTDDGPVRLTAEAADTPAEREHGLMGRTSLAPDKGMVFLYEGFTDGSFWMKDTLIPLSIAFWDEDGRIVGIQDMDPCTADPCPTYGSPEPYVGALEVNQGFFAEHGVVVGDRIDLS